MADQTLIRELRPHAIWDIAKEGAKLMLPFLAGIGIREWVHSHAAGLMWVAAIVMALIVAYGDRLLRSRVVQPSKEQSEEYTAIIKRLRDESEGYKAACKEWVHTTTIGFRYAKAAAMIIYGDESDNISQWLKVVWQHWYKADLKLSSPLVDDLRAQVPKWTEAVTGPVQELKNFKMFYEYHLTSLKGNIPSFRSSVTDNGCPSSKEYAALLNDLEEHTMLLKTQGEEALKYADDELSGLCDKLFGPSSHVKQ
jgi:hypothetical protein